MSNTDKDFVIGAKVVLIDDYEGLQSGATGIISSVYTSKVDINHIEGEIIEYCNYCESYNCDCGDYELEDWSADHNENDTFYIPKHYLKVISTPQVDTLILLV